MRHLLIATCFLLATAACADDKLDALQRELTRLQEAPRKGAAYERNVPLAMLAAKKARMLEAGAGLWFGGEDLKAAIIAQGETALRRAHEGQEPSAAAGRLNELAYLTANDGTVQPYYLYLPPDYTPKRKWPLITFLHGYVPTTSFLEPWIPPDSVCNVAGKHGALLLVPYGRRNTDFQGVGEVDVFASIAEVCKHFAVDHDRLYLSGVSMGGMGAWNIALRHPGVFAAVTPMCGQTDMFRWWGWPREDTPAWKRWLVEWDNALDQAPNLRNQNFFVQHGEMDQLIPAEQTKLMIEAAERQGTPIRSHFLPGESHFIYFLDASYDSAWGWQKQFSLQRSPRRVDLKAYSLEYNRAFWLTIDDFNQWGVPAEIAAEAAPDGKSLKVSSTNVRRLTVELAQAGLKPPLQVTWNDEAVEPSIDKGLLTLRLPAPPDGPQRKVKGLCGPCEEVFDTRFLVVQGTGGGEEQKAALARQVAQWAKDWDAFADGLPPVKTDAEVTAEDVRDCNLVLFGTPETNSQLGRIAALLPIKIGDHRYEVGGTVYEGADLGLVMCYPNPLNPARYVLIYSGEPYGERLSVNHKHDLLPDYVVFTTQRFAREDTNEALCAGFFGMNWELLP